MSLVPHATELLFELGLGPQVIAVTHECDHPPEATLLPTITRDVLAGEPGWSEGDPAAIDRLVREHTQRGESIYALDTDMLAGLAPDLIVTQSLCSVCAVSYEDVAALAQEIPSQPMVIALDPKTLGESLEDIATVARATDRRDAAVELVRGLAARVDRVRLAVRRLPRPRVAALEWLDPVYVAGHWVPQLIDLSGGEDLLGFAGEPSARSEWEELRAIKPEVVLIMPCGYDARRAQAEALDYAEPLASLGAERIVALDANAYFSRPGPRLVDGLELLAHVLHPGSVDPPPAAEVLEVRADARR